MTELGVLICSRKRSKAAQIFLEQIIEIESTLCPEGNSRAIDKGIKGFVANKMPRKICVSLVEFPLINRAIASHG